MNPNKSIAGSKKILSSTTKIDNNWASNQHYENDLWRIMWFKTGLKMLKIQLCIIGRN